jgi:hypothetical protein
MGKALKMEDAQRAIGTSISGHAAPDMAVKVFLD